MREHSCAYVTLCGTAVHEWGAGLDYLGKPSGIARALKSRELSLAGSRKGSERDWKYKGIRGIQYTFAGLKMGRMGQTVSFTRQGACIAFQNFVICLDGVFPACLTRVQPLGLAETLLILHAISAHFPPPPWLGSEFPPTCLISPIRAPAITYQWPILCLAGPLVPL